LPSTGTAEHHLHGRHGHDVEQPGKSGSASAPEDGARQHFERALDLRRQLGQQNPGQYLPYVAATLNSLALVDERQNRIGQSRARYTDALGIFKSLGDSRYAGEVASVQARLEELAKKAPAQ
jgi:hypothetical protein